MTLSEKKNNRKTNHYSRSIECRTDREFCDKNYIFTEGSKTLNYA